MPIPDDQTPRPQSPDRVPAAEIDLADAVAAIFATGFHLDESALAFIANALDAPESLVPALADPEARDAESVAALVFSPEPAMLVSLEETIDRAVLDAAAVDRVIDRIVSRGPRTRLTFSDGRPAVDLTVPAFGVAHFVRALQPERRLAPEIRDAITARIPEDLQAPLKSRLRRMHLPEVGPGRDRLMELIQTVSPTDTRLIDLVAALAEWLTEWPQNEPLYGWLMRRKHRLLSMVTRARRFDDALHHHNVETLMLRGEIPPHVDAAAARERIGWIDAIGFYLFGRTEMMTSSESAVQIDPNAPEAALDQTLRHLS